MKTFIPYRLKSNPKREIIVPETYAKKAKDLVEISMNIMNVNDLEKVINQNPEFKKGGYIALVLDFLHLQEKDEGVYIKARGEDRIYITTCLNLAYDDFSSREGLKKEDAMNKIKFFDKILESL
jgi:hypothetical protein